MSVFDKTKNWGKRNKVIVTFYIDHLSCLVIRKFNMKEHLQGKNLVYIECNRRQNPSKFGRSRLHSKVSTTYTDTFEKFPITDVGPNVLKQRYPF